MELRDYQKSALDRVYATWESGKQNVMLVMPTGSGKTVVFCSILANHVGRSVAIAHRSEILGQMALTLAHYGIYHDIIAQKQTIKNIVTLQVKELGRHYYNKRAACTVAGIDTLVKLPYERNRDFFNGVTLIIQDEGHHVLKANKWGKIAEIFSNAKGLYPTATPIRADGHGLGRDSDGIIDALVIGQYMRPLITLGHLCGYRIFAPPSDLDLSGVPIISSGDYSQPKLRTAVHKSHIVGDIVGHYLKISPGKLGLTFAVDITSAVDIADGFRKQNVPAEVISGKTPMLLRHHLMRKFRNREILQLVSVDLLGEGVDVPAIEVVSMGRPTQSYALFSQQFGRALRPAPNKTHAIIIDHVGNVMRHGLPDKNHAWTLNRRERKTKSDIQKAEIKICLNPECFSAYEAFYSKCPYCGHKLIPRQRSTPEQVEGDLLELDEKTLINLRGEIQRIDGPAAVPQHLSMPAQIHIKNVHGERQQNQANLREHIALWAGVYKHKNLSDGEIYRKFFYEFGIDVLSAQALNSKNSKSLLEKIKNSVDTALSTD